ncbi:serum paraoxonase/arylesterase family protein [Xylariaceae sp. FL0594]|nr:serum paraoxonase/arylesterase family protein [Xylariaceae sp. FL0594]
MAVFSYFFITLLGVLGAWLYPPVRHFTTNLGFRPFESAANVHGLETIFIPDTVACEDLEYHAPSGLLFTACSNDLETTRGWMPGGDALGHPDRPSYGSLVVIDPKTFKSQKLKVDNFHGPFATHGIGLYTPPTKPNLVYIYAINHLPNPRWTPGSKTEEKAASKVELFLHKVGSKTAKHVRSIAHPLITTPNDILAISESEFLVTNDHYYREGFMRTVEEFIRGLQSWANLLHVRFNDKGVDAAVVLDSVPTNNGLGWGPNGQVIIGDALGGHVLFASLPGAENRTMTVSHSVPVDCVVDNANFFSDPYAGVDGKDYSGYILPGLSSGMQFMRNFKDPTFSKPMAGQVWYLPAIAGKDRSIDGTKLRKLLFKDDGYTIRSVTTSVLVAIDPATNAGKREGWLFVTSVIGAQMLATKIDFASVLA